MRSLLFLMAVSVALVAGRPAQAVESVILDAIQGWLGPSGTDDLSGQDDTETELPAAPATPDVPAYVLAKANELAFAALGTASDDNARAAALKMVASLARFGDLSARWAFLRNYHMPEATLLRAEVSAAEMTRFGLDLLLVRDPAMEKLEMEFTFAMAQIYADGQSDAFAGSFLAMLREDERLRSRPNLGDILQALVFVPGACDAIIERATKEGAAGIPADGFCGDNAIRDALLAYAEAAGPSSIEATARRAAAAEIHAMADTGP